MTGFTFIVDCLTSADVNKNAGKLEGFFFVIVLSVQNILKSTVFIVCDNCADAFYCIMRAKNRKQ